MAAGERSSFALSSDAGVVKLEVVEAEREATLVGWGGLESGD